MYFQKRKGRGVNSLAKDNIFHSHVWPHSIKILTNVKCKDPQKDLQHPHSKDSPGNPYPNVNVKLQIPTLPNKPHGILKSGIVPNVTTRFSQLGLHYLGSPPPCYKHVCNTKRQPNHALIMMS